MTLLAVEHVSKIFRQGLLSRRQCYAVKNVSFTMEEGDLLGLSGMSGSGKSTLIRMLMQLIPADEGRIVFQGEDLAAFSEKKQKVVKRQMQMLFQNPASALHPRMTILEIMKEPALIHGVPEMTEKELLEILDRLQLRSELLGRYPQELSGGELQRICLARLLTLHPRLLLLDEPTSMLDVSVQAQIISLLKEIQTEYGLACLFISHDMDLLKAICQRIGIMKDGQLIELQETAALYSHPKEVYTKDLINAFETF